MEKFAVDPNTGSPGRTSAIDLKALSASELEDFLKNLGYPIYRARQIYRWIYARGVNDLADMTDVPAALRSRLEEIAVISCIVERDSHESKDGTIKTLFSIASGRSIETVLIPDFDAEGETKRTTACVSSQVGCAMACSFCATGQMGFQQQLSSGEIFDQVYQTNKLALRRYDRPLSNVVFMGMGEPMLNYGAVSDSIEKITNKNGLAMAARRITVSTVGLAGQIRRFADDNPGCNLAVSLHAPTDEKRRAIMPVNRKAKTDLSALRSAIQYYVEKTKRPITYEYCLFEGFNDSMEDARNLARLSHWAPSKVNLIMYNPVAGVRFSRSDEATVDSFAGILVSLGVTVTVRRSRGQDIAAACGQLAIHSQASRSETPGAP